MKTFVCASVALALAAVLCTAQEKPATVDFRVYDGSAGEAVEALQQATGLKPTYNDVDADDMSFGTVLVATGLGRDDASRALAFATGCNVQLEPQSGILRIAPPGERARGGNVKGYDVSVLAGRYVEYVNTWGAAKRRLEKDVKPEPERTAAEYLAGLIEDLLYDPWGEDLTASVVGDRILFTTHDSSHGRVRELLDLLMKDGGGESSDLQRERDVVQKLKDSPFSVAYDNTPIASVLAGICVDAEVGLVLGREMAFTCSDFHTSIAFSKKTCWDALKTTLDILKEEDFEPLVGVRGGCVAIELDRDDISRGYRVYDIAELLKKLAAAYQRQGTAPGKEGGYDGDLKDAGGNFVVLDSLYDLLDAGGHEGQCFVYGARLVVRGNVEAIDAATEILEQMGWEKPKD
ncbi:MAG: hypothetical protein KDB32_03285 [Planctomycetes bacterium]|nr:hypothetical protein [Planctomycetota bacterium]